MIHLPFIELDQLEEQAIFNRLNQCFRSGSIVPLVGLYGTGKSRLLEHVVREKLTYIDLDQVILVRLKRPRKSDRGSNASTVTLTLFSRLLHILRVLYVSPPVDWRETLNQDSMRDFNDTQFRALFDKVALAMERKGIRGLIIDNAQHTDETTLEWTMQLWEECHHHFGIVFSAQVQKDETAGELLAKVFNRVPLARDSCTDVVKLAPMSDDDLVFTVLPGILDALNADLNAEARRNQGSFIEQTLAYAQNNWVPITTFATVLDEELGSEPCHPRHISPGVIERTFNRLRGVRKLWYTEG